MRVVCIDLIDTSSAQTSILQNIAEVFLRYTPQVALGARSVFLEIGACHRLYSESNFLLRARVILKKMGVKARMGVSESPAMALAFARHGISDKCKVPISALPFFVNPFLEVSSLEKMLALFKYLGVETLGDLLKLSREQLTSRMGREVTIARHYIDMATALPWPRFYPQEKIIERYEMAEMFSIQNLEPMMFALKQILDCVTLRLRGRGQVVTSFQLRVFQDRYSTTQNYKRSWEFALSFPVHSTRDLLTIIRERLSSSLQKEPLESAIRELELEVVGTVTFAGRQTHFFSKKEEESESFQSVVARLTERLGDGRVFMAKPVESYVVDRSWSKSAVCFLDFESKAKSNINAVPVPFRPLRILSRPVVLQKIENHLVHANRHWQILKWLGPERISGEWWWGDTERDYFRVLTDTGEELWVYKNTDNLGSEYFLHGVFD